MVYIYSNTERKKFKFLISKVTKSWVASRVVPDIRLAGYPAFFDIRYPAGYPAFFISVIRPDIRLNC